MRSSFYRDEPLNCLTGYSEEKAKDMDTMIMEYFQDGLSHIVVEKETNQIAGARIIAVHKRENADTPRVMESAEMKKIWPFLHQLDENSNIFKLYPDMDSYVELFMASVDRRFRGQGLATEMYESAIPFLKDRGFRLVKSCFTSPFTHRIGKKLGFRELTRRFFRDYRDESGEVVFTNAEDKDEAVVGALEL
ncbi:Dopamine N-acetyltransferase [Orchesella cincta]|uniref:Dopamine N-acetyltransferase n=1 Tax=Orchesella cincta TaxID=48709 RepID=A0A1D2MRP8_ORCCI|nr:Dopamine N-acetyltransferase [Orchesella cincta]